MRKAGGVHTGDLACERPDPLSPLLWRQPNLAALHELGIGRQVAGVGHLFGDQETGRDKMPHPPRAVRDRPNRREPERSHLVEQQVLGLPAVLSEEGPAKRAAQAAAPRGIGVAFDVEAGLAVAVGNVERLGRPAPGCDAARRARQDVLHAVQPVRAQTARDRPGRSGFDPCAACRFRSFGGHPWPAAWGRVGASGPAPPATAVAPSNACIVSITISVFTPVMQRRSSGQTGNWHGPQSTGA